jgi:hypothetical protein
MLQVFAHRIQVSFYKTMSRISFPVSIFSMLDVSLPHIFKHLTLHQCCCGDYWQGKNATTMVPRVEKNPEVLWKANVCNSLHLST